MHIGSFSPQIMPEEDRDISTPAPIPAPVEELAHRKPRRPRKVQGDDENPEIILFVGSAGPTSDTYLPISDLAQSQQALLTNTLWMYRDKNGYWVYMKTSQREFSMKVKKCIDKWTGSNRSQPTDMTLYAETACEYCRSTGRTCARIVLHDGQYKLAVFPHHSHEGITIDDAGFWLA